MATSSFGALNFISMEPRPVLPQHQVALESKAGVAGHGAFLTGVRSRPHTVTTVRDVASWAAALTLCGTYEAAVGSVLAITYGGVATGAYALILSVECQPEKVVAGVGGIGGTAAAIVTAKWQIEVRV
jgi:hypothetical protein